jgi:hypothetical protein
MHAIYFSKMALKKDAVYELVPSPLGALQRTQISMFAICAVMLLDIQ